MRFFGWGSKPGHDARRTARGTAAVARETILLAHGGALGATSDLLTLLCESIVTVICRHVACARSRSR